MSDLDRYLTEELVERTMRALYTYEELEHPFECLTRHDLGWLEGQARASLSAVLPDIIQQAKAEALRELRDHLTEPRRLWCGDMGVRVALVIDDPRSHLALSDYLDYRADRIEQGGRP